MKIKKAIILIIFLMLSGCGTKTYTITFDTSGGMAMNSVVINEGETLDNIDVPIKEGYLFVSWLKDGLKYDPNSPVTEDITLTATWIEVPEVLKEYTVTFISDDQIERISVKENDTVPEPTIKQKENYLFLGWYVGDEKYDFNNKVTKDIVLTAKYELNVVSVTYDLDGGYGLAIETVPKNKTIPIPETPTKPGYKFLKWTLNGKDFTFNEKINEDITLKAVWEKIEYVTVIFDSNGGNKVENKIIEKYSRLAELPIPVKEGYIFKEWQLDNQTFDTDTVITKDITLKAIYEIKKAGE